MSPPSPAAHLMVPGAHDLEQRALLLGCTRFPLERTLLAAREGRVRALLAFGFGYLSLSLRSLETLRRVVL